MLLCSLKRGLPAKFDCRVLQQQTAFFLTFHLFGFFTFLSPQVNLLSAESSKLQMRTEIPEGGICYRMRYSWGLRSQKVVAVTRWGTDEDWDPRRWGCNTMRYWWGLRSQKVVVVTQWGIDEDRGPRKWLLLRDEVLMRTEVSEGYWWGLRSQKVVAVTLVERWVASEKILAGSEIPGHNRRFPEITGKDNLTVFSYSGRVKSPEWRRQLRRADLRQF